MPEENPATHDLFEIIRTTRSMRRLKPDPVPDELIQQILEAGTCAPSGGNMQRWRFLIIKDPAIKETVGAFYKRAWDEQVGPRYRAGEPAPGLAFEKEAEAALGLPPDWHSYAILPIGYPLGRFGPVRRVALADVAYEDRWGQPYTGDR